MKKGPKGLSQNDNEHQLRNLPPVERPPFEKFYIYLLLLYFALLTADLIILSIRDKMMPTSAPPSRQNLAAPTGPRMESYDNIVSRNIFNHDGVIPPPVSKGASPMQDDSVPVPTSLPIQLIGTIVHVNPARSVATVELKSQNKIIPFIPNDDMEGLATLLKIERKRIIFRNSSNRRLEYAEIKDDKLVTFEVGKKPKATSIEQRGNNFTLQRSTVDKLLNNLPEHLQQARAVPFIPPGSNRVEGFIILDIAQGSIFEQIGLKKNDVIRGVNGQKVDSPAKALELYQTLKDATNIALDIDRDGRGETFNYTIQ